MIEQRSTIALIVVQTLLGLFPNKNAPHALKPIQTAWLAAQTSVQPAHPPSSQQLQDMDARIWLKTAMIITSIKFNQVMEEPLKEGTFVTIVK